MHTNDPQIIHLIEDAQSLAKDFFSDRLQSFYLLGSLARGGFSKIASDIDICILINSPLKDSDGSDIDTIQQQLKLKHQRVGNDVSIFWGSIESISEELPEGRLPAFDHLDLIDHGVLLSGVDVQGQLSRPSQRTLEVEGMNFALWYLGKDESIEEFHSPQTMYTKGVVHITKRALFAARFLYLLKTGEVSGNDVSVNYYLENIKSPMSELVRKAYQWREQGLASEEEVVPLLETYLIPIYQHFLELYIEKLQTYGEDELVNNLINWKEKLSN